MRISDRVNEIQKETRSRLGCKHEASDMYHPGGILGTQVEQLGYQTIECLLIDIYKRFSSMEPDQSKRAQERLEKIISAQEKRISGLEKRVKRLRAINQKHHRAK